KRCNRQHRRALDLERDRGAATESNVDGASAHRLDKTRIAAEIRDLEVDAMLLENTSREADVRGQECEILRLRLAEPDFGLSQRIDDAERCDADRERQPQQCEFAAQPRIAAPLAAKRKTVWHANAPPRGVSGSPRVTTAILSQHDASPK